MEKSIQEKQLKVEDLPLEISFDADNSKEKAEKMLEKPKEVDKFSGGLELATIVSLQKDVKHLREINEFGMSLISRTLLILEGRPEKHPVGVKT